MSSPLQVPLEVKVTEILKSQPRCNPKYIPPHLLLHFIIHWILQRQLKFYSELTLVLKFFLNNWVRYDRVSKAVAWIFCHI